MTVAALPNVPGRSSVLVAMADAGYAGTDRGGRQQSASGAGGRRLARCAGAFCELGTGEVDLDSFLAELDGYAGWLVVEQDWVRFEAQRGTVPGSPSTPDLSPSA
jgi:sugar phosphate isomerase/epimerase